MRDPKCGVVAPGRNAAVVCFEGVTSLSTLWADPGRNALKPWLAHRFRIFTRANFCVVGVEIVLRLIAVLEPVRNGAVACFE